MDDSYDFVVFLYSPNSVYCKGSGGSVGSSDLDARASDPAVRKNLAVVKISAHFSKMVAVARAR